MRQLSFGILLMALSTLLLEIQLTRVFDVILTPGVGFMVITLAMFGLGLAGIYTALRPPPPSVPAEKYLALAAIAFAASNLLILPGLNLLPFDYEEFFQSPFVQLGSFGAMYLLLVVPFFLSGLVFAIAFSRYARHIQRLYFWDLCGAAIGSVALIPLLPIIGPGGLLFWVAGMSFIAAALFYGTRRASLICVPIAAGLLATPFLVGDDALDFRIHVEKRGLEAARAEGTVEFSRWDPISKIDIAPAAFGTEYNDRKHILYDGGNQSSYFYSFDGDVRRLRAELDEGAPGSIAGNFWQRGVLASHYLKRDSDQAVLIFGSAGGQETKAALTYGAARVDGVELVGTVVELGKGRYSSYIGDIFNHPNVDIAVGEGRSLLRASSDRYDIIQIFSNHTSSSIAQGNGAFSPFYLHTAEAYAEYFEHLEPNGILHVNSHYYPRMITSAAMAWRSLGRTDFRSHVVVYERQGREMENLPTMLIKMQPWSADEVEELAGFFSQQSGGEEVTAMVENPVAAQESFLSDEFYSGSFPDSLKTMMEYRATPTTDDWPFFNQVRRPRNMFKTLDPDTSPYLNAGSAGLINSLLESGRVPMDFVPLIVAGLVSLLFASAFVVVPLRFSRAGREAWEGKYESIAYFACLGAGFIILELVFIQLFMKLIGYPLYTVSTVLFVMLLAAGIGSLSSHRLGIDPERRWSWPFIGVLATGVLLLLTHQMAFDLVLAAPLAVRVVLGAAMIFPLGFALGMAFPLGILAVQGRASGAVAWAWGINGAFTLIGGLLSSILAMTMGFRATIAVALGIYLLAFLLFAKIAASHRPDAEESSPVQPRERELVMEPV